MKYLQLEHALNEAAGGSIASGPFLNKSNNLAEILRSKKTTPMQKSKDLAGFIRKCLLEFKKVNKGEFEVYDTEQYGKLVGRDRITVSHWVNAGKIPNAFCLGSGRNSKWAIIVKT